MAEIAFAVRMHAHANDLDPRHVASPSTIAQFQPCIYSDNTRDISEKSTRDLSIPEISQEFGAQKNDL
jgi:hypothetical protein